MLFDGVSTISASDSVAESVVLALNLTDIQDVFEWRVRAQPHIGAEEIRILKHGDRITAAADSGSPGWFKLVEEEKAWVKQDHDGYTVWYRATATSPDAPAIARSVSPSSKCVVDTKRQSLAQLPHHIAIVPKQFAGTPHKLGATGASHWFNGQPHRIPDDAATALKISKGISAKPRWADIVDFDDDDLVTTPRFSARGFLADALIMQAELTASPAGSAGRHQFGFYEASVDVDTNDTKLKPCVRQSGDHETDVVIVEPIIRNPRKYAKNQAMLKKRNKTVLCQYLINDGKCHFGDKCWFAHNSEQLC